MTSPTLGTLAAEPALARPDLLATPVYDALARAEGVTRGGGGPGLASVLAEQVFVAEIVPDLADTAAFCTAYDVPLAVSANCVVVAGRRGDVTTLAACMVLATTRVDVNNAVRRRLGAKRASFAPIDVATTASGMEYGGITPIGLPADWPILVDPLVAASPLVVIGSGLRRSKLLLPGRVLAALPRGEVLEGLGLPAAAREDGPGGKRA